MRLRRRDDGPATGPTGRLRCPHLRAKPRYAAVSMRCAPSMYFSAAFWVKLGKAASVWPSAMRSALPPEPGERFLRGRVRRCAVPDLPSSAGTVTWVGGAAIVAVHGGLDPVASSQARERIALVIGDGPQRLVLNLVDVRDRFAAECLALIAVTRHLLPPGCVLDVCSVGLAVHRILALTGWSRPDPAARPCQVPRPGGSQCPILGLPLEAVPCAGPVRLGGTGSSRGQVPDPRNRRGPVRDRRTRPRCED